MITGEYLRRALLLRWVYQEWVGVYPLPKCPRRRANPWAQDLCKHPSVSPYPAPPKVKMHKMAPWEQPPPQFGVSLLDCPFSHGKLQLLRPSHQLIYRCLVGADGQIVAPRARRGR